MQSESHPLLAAGDPGRNPGQSVVQREGTWAAASAERAAPLDLLEGICDPPLKTGCSRWPKHLSILNQLTGELFPGRCKATNLCRYCQAFFVRETVEMLTLDAVEYAPTLWAVLTAREHLTRSDTYDHLRQLRKAARKIWPSIEWFVQVEFQRRGALHLNLLLKGVPLAEQDALYDCLVGLWISRVDALGVRDRHQWLGPIDDPEGVLRYLQKTLAHGLKAEQAPPLGWRGHRTSQTRGYLVRPASVMREEARQSLRLKRKLRAGQSLEVALHELHEDGLTPWKLHSNPDTRPERAVPDYDPAMSRSARAPFPELRKVVGA